MEELLKQIVKNTASKSSQKSSLQIVVSGTTSQIRTAFNAPIQLDKNKRYEMALVNLETYYSFPNITAENNQFKYSPDDGVSWFTIFIPEGSYEVKDLNESIQDQMKQKNHYDNVNDKYYISITPNASTLRCILTLENKYRVDFTHPNSLSSVLGFNNKIYSDGYNASENVVNIITINSIFANTDIVGGSYVNGLSKPTIYSFFPNVSPGYKIVENPRNLVYLPLLMDTISSIETSLTDQNGKLLNLRGENLTIRFHIREA
jgi:hypothetical protein